MSEQELHGLQALAFERMTYPNTTPQEFMENSREQGPQAIERAVTKYMEEMVQDGPEMFQALTALEVIQVSSLLIGYLHRVLD